MKKIIKKNGRPSKIDNIDFNEVEKLAGYGLTDIQIADILNICKATINNYKKNPKFLDSIKRGKLKSNTEVVKSLYKRALGYNAIEEKVTKDGDVVEYEKHIPGDVLAQIFWLCNRQKDNWQNVNKVEHSGDKDNPVRFFMDYAKPKK